jgi:hypothetical protein
LRDKKKLRLSKKSKIVVIPRRNDEGTDQRELNEVNLLIINLNRFLHFLPAGRHGVRNDVFKTFWTASAV